MKVIIEKVPDDVRISFTHDAAKKPVVILVRLEMLDQYVGLIRTAMGATTCRFEFQM